MMTNGSLVSPRLAVLQQAFDAGHGTAVDTFWREVVSRGAPLIEEPAEDPSHLLVTFLWRGTEQTTNVLVYQGLATFDVVADQMTHLHRTNVWYKTYHASRDTRTTYRLLPNDSLDSSPDAWGHRWLHAQPDPLNPHTFAFRDEDLHSTLTFSVLELPDAPAQPWATSRPGVMSGQVQRHDLYSSLQQRDRRIWIYTPPDYTETAMPHSVLVLFDGLGYAQAIPTSTILDNLQAANLLPPLVAVMIDNQIERHHDLPCSPSFIDYVVQELLPWVRRTYHVTSEPTRTIVAGASAGGAAAAYAGLRYPNVFGHVLSQSGLFWWSPEGEQEGQWLIRQFDMAPRLPLRFHLDVGTLEASSVGLPDIVGANRFMRDVLQTKGYVVHYAEFSGGHDWICWQGTLPDGLVALVGDTHEGVSELPRE